MVLDPWPDHLLTLAEWDALGHDPRHRFELVEGVLVVVPRPTAFHQFGMIELIAQLRGTLPTGLIVLPEVEVVTGGGHPASVRVPDVVVVHRSAIADNPARLEASAVRLVVEVLSPGTGRTDTVTKLVEYADAGIPAYWIVDLDPPVSMTAYLLVDGEYEITAQGTGRLALLTPVELRVDLDRLLP